MSASAIEARQQLESQVRLFSVACAAGAGIIASTVLVGWASGIGRLSAFLAGATTMKANLALGVLASALAISAIARGRGERAARLIALAVCALGAATLLQDLLGIRLGIDELLVADPAEVGITGVPGRMAPNAALSLVLLGGGAWLTARGGTALRWGQACGSLVAVIGLLAIYGYAHDAERLYNLKRSVTALAFPAAIALFLGGTALFLARRGGLGSVIASPDPGGVLLRRLVPVALLAPLLVDLLVLRLAAPVVGTGPAQALTTTIITLGLVLLLFAVAASLDRQAAARRLTAEAVQRHEKQYRELFENMDAGFAVHRVVVEDGEPVDYVYEEVNDSFCELTGLVRDEVVGKPVTEVIPGIAEDSFDWIGRLGRVAQTGEPARFEQQSEALERWYSVLAYQPRPGFFATIFTDVTERRKNHERIEKLNRVLQRRSAELAETNRWLEAFNYSVSHDLRAPLRAIDGFSEAVVEDYGAQLPEDAQNFLGRVRAAAQRMGKLIDDLLQLSRISRSELRLEPIDLAEGAEEVVAELRDAEPEREVRVTVSEDLHAEADPRLARMLLANLVGNAWKFSSKQKRANIEVGVEERDGERRFFVRDDGVGFDPAYADKLFGAFQRLHSDADFAGTGVGLATVQRIVQRHGGRVWAESEPGEGATFWFTLGSRPDD